MNIFLVKLNPITGITNFNAVILQNLSRPIYTIRNILLSL